MTSTTTTNCGSKMVVFARWSDRPAWQRVIDSAPKQIDDASHAVWWKERYELPMLVEVRENDAQGRNLFSTRTDAMRGLAAPINRPRCELQAACKALQAVLRHGGSDKSKKWTQIDINVNDSLYLAANATLPRLHTWYKNAYKNIANRELWENIRLALDRLAAGGIECRFVSSIKQTTTTQTDQLLQIFDTKKRNREEEKEK